MYSRAHLLIEREFKNMSKDPPWGIEAWPMYDDTIFEWMAKIRGLQRTSWEGGIFKIYIKFDEHFSVRPPQVLFQTIPFHPNVEVCTGRPCVDFLDDYSLWKENFSISMLLVSLQTLLSFPVLKNAVNPEAASMLQNSPQSYRQMTQECVTASQRVEAGGSPQVTNPDSHAVRFNQPDVPARSTHNTRTAGATRVSKLSFDDYHNTWCGIATSKTRPDAVNPFLESIRGNPKLQEIHLGVPREELEDQMRKQMEEHSVLMYGKFKSQPSMESVRDAKIAHLERMKRIYLAPRQSPLPPREEIDIGKSLPALQATDANWEKEVDDLVNWTNTLDSNAIDAS
ncbi:ubiquitin-conjugating enzyme e2 u [Plakobranchus ocellatus]|uniref:Ubiquitin-conjugating enzyme e2 u n=1 Tax=Plakobranchus ocellatus TaxID=259542 RepID=A0AAV4A779_9GAST|nr:ubiquitin-conjugating enzyme e2 u [Plakobranchus ocellatus]